MGVQYAVTTGLVSIAASVTKKVAVEVNTPATVANQIIAFDVCFDSVATGAGAAPIRVSLVRATGASSGGAAATPTPYNKWMHAAASAARINDITPGTGPTIIQEWEVPPTSGLSYQFPLGREIQCSHSDFLELQLTTIAGMTTCNYIVNVVFEE